MVKNRRYLDILEATRNHYNINYLKPHSQSQILWARDCLLRYKIILGTFGMTEISYTEAEYVIIGIVVISSKFMVNWEDSR
jgi:hypothetical protein